MRRARPVDSTPFAPSQGGLSRLVFEIQTYVYDITVADDFVCKIYHGRLLGP